MRISITIFILIFFTNSIFGQAGISKPFVLGVIEEIQATVNLPESFSQQTKIYIGVGKEGLTPSDIPHVMEVDTNLLADKIKNVKNKNTSVYFDYLPQEDHATIAHQAIYNALRLLSSGD